MNSIFFNKYGKAEEIVEKLSDDIDNLMRDFIKKHNPTSVELRAIENYACSPMSVPHYILHSALEMKKKEREDMREGKKE